MMETNYEHDEYVDRDLSKLFYILILIIFTLCLVGMYLQANKTASTPKPTVNYLEVFRPLVTDSDTIELERATTYWCDTAQCDSNPFTTADGSIINPDAPQRWVALSRDLLFRWGGEFHYGDTIEIYSKEHPNVNGLWRVSDCMSAKYTMSIDFLMSPEMNVPKLGIGSDVKIIVCGED